VLYFGFFLLMPFYTRKETPSLELPARVTAEPELDESLKKNWPRIKEQFLAVSVIREIKIGSGTVYKVPVLDVEALLALIKNRVSNLTKSKT
jgi:hypothetical protein